MGEVQSETIHLPWDIPRWRHVRRRSVNREGGKDEEEG